MIRILRVALAALLVWAVVAWGAARALVVSAKVERADVLVILSGASAYVERTRHAARIVGEGRAQRVVLTDDGMRGGWASAEQRNPLFVERAAEQLRQAGVPGDQIEVLPGMVSSTHEEAVRIREYALARGERSLLVVTSPYHTRRALWMFRRVFEGSGVRVGISSPAEVEAVSPSPFVWWLSQRGWRLVAGEYVKLVYYRFKY